MFWHCYFQSFEFIPLAHACETSTFPLPAAKSAEHISLLWGFEGWRQASCQMQCDSVCVCITVSKAPGLSIGTACEIVHHLQFESMQALLSKTTPLRYAGWS